MKHSLLFIAITGCCILFSPRGFAGEFHFFQQPQKDSTPAKNFQRVRVAVRDLMDGQPLDSVYVTVGLKNGYTDKNGVVEFDSIHTALNVTASKPGYLAQSLSTFLSKVILQIKG